MSVIGRAPSDSRIVVNTFQIFFQGICPGGTPENSPAIYGWVGVKSSKAPEGRQKGPGTAMMFFRP